jgi:hypothetical protein
MCSQLFSSSLYLIETYKFMCNKMMLFSSSNFEDVDRPIIYNSKFDEYGIKIMDGGSSSIEINYCPWCGERLPNSRRDEWFDILEKLGIDPWGGDVPEIFRTDEWYKKEKF